jgi:hypothetical protein
LRSRRSILCLARPQPAPGEEHTRCAEWKAGELLVSDLSLEAQLSACPINVRWQPRRGSRGSFRIVYLKPGLFAKLEQHHRMLAVEVDRAIKDHARSKQGHRHVHFSRQSENSGLERLRARASWKRYTPTHQGQARHQSYRRAPYPRPFDGDHHNIAPLKRL